MNRSTRTLLALAAGTFLAPAAASATPLQIVQVGAPAINCVFNPSCTLTIADFSFATLGGGFVQSRTYQAASGAPAAGRWMYQYRVDLTRAAATTAVPRVTSLTIDFGPVVPMDFNGDGSTEQVFVITQGGLGSVAPVSAEQTGRRITFTFDPAVQAGATTFFIGLVSDAGPVQAPGTLVSNVQPNITIQTRAPRNQGGRPPRVPPGQVNQPLRPIAAEDCLPYNPQNLRIVDEGASGWLLTDGVSRMLTLDNQADAERALALARRHTAHCFIGRGNTRPDRPRYISHYWTGNSGITTTIAGEDCISYNPGTVGVFDRGALGWRLEDGSNFLVLFDNHADANRGLTVARAASRLCFVGRNNARPDRFSYIFNYWR
jgi:hypothetical protein